MPDMAQEHKIQHVEIPSSQGYVDIVIQSAGQFIGALKECKDCGWASSWDTLQTHAHFSWIELLCVILCALAWTGLRMATTTWIFQAPYVFLHVVLLFMLFQHLELIWNLYVLLILSPQPFSKWCQLRPREAEKVPESAWKLLFYSCSWSYCSYLLFFTEHNFFHDPPSTFNGWKSGVAVPKEIALVYLIQGSFYAHSTYATLYMDAWRKDSIVMIVHHVVTFTLISFSYAFRYHNIGILVLFLHDFNDILLEFTKLNIYFKTRGGTYHKINATITDIGSVLFSVSWFWFRLYWFPIKVLHVTCCSSLESNPNIPFYFFFNVLLFLLTLMNIYWFLYIVMFVVKVLTGQVKEVNDVREYDISEGQKMDHNNTSTRHKDTMNSKQHMSNGYVKKKRV